MKGGGHDDMEDTYHDDEMYEEDTEEGDELVPSDVQIKILTQPKLNRLIQRRL